MLNRGGAAHARARKTTRGDKTTPVEIAAAAECGQSVHGVRRRRRVQYDRYTAAAAVENEDISQWI